jgi:hypothetical protein
MSRPAALVLTGDLGMGHHMVSQVVADSLERQGWRTEILDCMTLLGPLASRAGEWVFHRLTAIPSLYDATYFAHLRPGSRLALAMDRAATARLIPALTAHLTGDPVELAVATFATGASAIAQLAFRTEVTNPPASVALCTDVGPHRLWVRDGLNLFLVTSPAAAAAVRRHAPRLPIAIVPPPVRAPFYEVPGAAVARAALGLAPDGPCVLVMGGGWGLGPMAETARALADRGVTVLAVAGHNHRLGQSLAEMARRNPRLIAYDFTNQIPLLMAAADLVLTTPGATTCSEARVVGRPLMLLDVMPGHGRDNLQHELEMGRADVCDPDPARLVDCVLEALRRTSSGEGQAPASDRFPDTFAAALGRAGIVPGEPERTGRSSRPPVPMPQEVH